MKKHLRSMLVLMLIVPCLVMFAACGDATYKFNTIRIKEGETTTSYNLANFKAKMKDDYIKSLTGVTDPNATQIAAAKLTFEIGILENLLEDFADAASSLFESTFDNYGASGYKGSVKNAISTGLFAWNGSAPANPTIGDHINAVKNTDMTALADTVYAVNNATFLSEKHDTADKAKGAIKAVLGRLHVAKTGELHAGRVNNYAGGSMMGTMVGVIGGVTLQVKGNRMTIKLDAGEMLGGMGGSPFGSSEELYSGQAKMKMNASVEISVGFTKDAEGRITFDDPGALPMPTDAIKMVGNTIELMIDPDVVIVFKK